MSETDLKLLKDVLALADNRRSVLKELDEVSHGVFGSAYLPSQNAGALANEYNALIKQAELPVCSLVIRAVTDRMQVEGVRAKNQQADDELWKWWQYSKLDSRQTQLYSDAMTFGDAYMSVVPGDTVGIPLMMPESPLVLGVENDPLDPLKVKVAAKQIDDQAWLYTDEFIIHYEREKPGSYVQWREVGRVMHPLGVCPIVRFPNKLDSAGRSESEITQVLPIQRRINQTIFTRLLLEATAAWKQRWVSGIDVETDDNGDAVPPFRTGVDNLWVSEDADTKFGEFQASSTADLLAAIEQDLRHISVVTQTPPTLFAVTSISNISAESLAVLEGGLTRKVQSKQQQLGEAFEYAMRLGGQLVGRTVPEDLEMIWGDYEISSLSQQSNAIVQLRSTGLPLEWLLERVMRLTPQAIDRVMQMYEREQAMAQAQAAENMANMQKAEPQAANQDGATDPRALSKETFMRPNS